MKNKKSSKCAVMFSGGLDSRLVIKLMKEKGFEVTALHFKLPFSKDVELEIRKFAKKHKVKLKLFDYSKGKLFKEYLELVKKPEFGRGRGVNPCIDCRLFMVKKAKEFMDKQGIEFLATGEVLGQRPMSQHKKGLNIIEEKSRLKGRLIRPLIEQGIQGRKREKQIKMAEKFKISYPNPAGGCLMCEKALAGRFKHLFKRGMEDYEAKLLNIGRHFVMDNTWVVLGRDEKENNVIEKLGKKQQVLVPENDAIGPSAIILGKANKKLKDKVKKLIKAYSKTKNQRFLADSQNANQGADIKDKKKFKRYVI